ncbi:1-acyl-sn-glycerol-3-phosphate acyltransferase [Xylariales sp. PMI_506]|nr:1-acyl-sn-glycerol-3-phosphate acyltransferase [Xylariales sp. PMI_506]
MAVLSAITSVRGALIVAPWLVYLGLADVGISLLLPIRLIAPDVVYDASSWIAYTVWVWIQFIFERLNGAQIGISGDTLPQGESAIVIANHVTWADFYMIQALAQKSGMLGRCRWFAKIQLRVVPFLGWGLWAMGMPMVSRNWMRDQHELNRVFSGIVERKWPTWLISFSEATRFTPKKYEETRVWCEQNDRPLPKHLLYPRTKGFITTVQHLRKARHVKAVYDLTIAYQHGQEFHKPPNMWETLKLPQISGGYGFKFHVHAQRFLLEDLPHSDEDLAQWLEKRWVEKGEWLDIKKQEWSAR